MTIIRLNAYETDPEKTEEMLAARARLIDTIHATCEGLETTVVARVDEHTWVDIWTWQSIEHHAAAVAAAQDMLEAAAAFAHTKNLQVTLAQVLAAG